VREATKTEIAREALDRIGKLYDVERQITGQPAAARLAVRREHKANRLDELPPWNWKPQQQQKAA